MNFVADAGKQMLESSSSVSEVLDRLRRFMPAVGLDGCSLDATLSSLILSYWRPGLPVPITTMRDVRVGDPRLERLWKAESLLDQVERGEIALGDAFEQLRELERAPAVRRGAARLALLGSVAGWVVFQSGFDLITILVALLATMVTFPIDTVVRRLRLPSLSGIVLTAVLVGAVPNLVAAAGVPVRVGPAVVGGLFVYLPGRALVSSLIDSLANAPLSAVARGIQAVVTAGALALGMLVGSGIGTGLGLNYRPDVGAVPVVVSVSAAVIGMLGLAVAWAMPRPLLAPTVAIGAGGWASVALAANRGDSTDSVVYAVAAGLVGVVGALFASRQGAVASVYTGVAILPLVPGFTLYRGVLAISEGRQGLATSALTEAGLISLAIAVGLVIGLAVGRNVLAVNERLSALRQS